MVGTDETLRLFDPRRRLFRRLPEAFGARIEEAQRLTRAHQLSAERLAAHVSVSDFKLPILPSVEQLGDKRFDVVIVLGIEDEIVRHAELLIRLLCAASHRPMSAL